MSQCCILGNGQGNRGADGKFINSKTQTEKLQLLCFIALETQQWQMSKGHDFKNRIPPVSQWLKFCIT